MPLSPRAVAGLSRNHVFSQGKSEIAVLFLLSYLPSTLFVFVNEVTCKVGEAVAVGDSVAPSTTSKLLPALHSPRA